MNRTLALLAVTALGAAPLLAQINPGTTALNNGVAAAGAATAAQNDATRAQYEADRAAYMDALVQHDRAVNRADARYVRQQNAYADAMAVWRVQVEQCKRGRQKACDMPPPNPADYY
jgi:hypothetical protein